MSEPSLTPNDTLPNVEATRSSSPTQGGGLHHEQRSPSHETLFSGRVEDAYGSAGGYLVALYNYKRNLPCYPLQGANGRFFGASDHAPIPIGTEVLVHCPRDGKFGHILGVLPTIEDPPHQRAAGQLVPEGGVNVFSDKEAFHAPEWGVGGLLPQAGGGLPVDALPGDAGRTNELNAGIGVNRLFAFLKGGELTGVEAHLLDDLLRLIGHRLQIFTAQGEERVNDDYGRIGRERLAALTPAESLGAGAEDQDVNEEQGDFSLAGDPDKSSLKAVTPGATGRWRLREEEGWMGDFFQRFLLRPSRAPRALDGQDHPADLTLFQEFLSRTGQRLQRFLVGGGSVKTLGIAGPRRLRADDDPKGDRETPDDKKREPFSLEPKGGSDGPGPAGFGAMVRDWLAWEFDQRAKASRAGLEKDWKTPGDHDALTPNGSFQTPGRGGYFREFPPLSDAARACGDVPDETDAASAPFRPGESFALLLPDGSVHSRDAWGTESFTRGGHATITASHDIHLTAGGSIILQAGDDIVLRAQQAIDLSSTKNQVRVKADRDVLIHSETGGMLLSAPTRGGKLDDYADDSSKGEGVSLSGIAFKTGGTVTAIADSANFALSRYFYVGGQSAEAPPDVLLRSRTQLCWSNAGIAFATDAAASSGVIVSHGSVYASGNFQNDGSLYVRNSIIAGGAVIGDGDFSQVEPIADSLKPAFNANLWEDFQQPYGFDDLEPLQFSFRTTEECAAVDLEAFESAWQREMSGLSGWTERAVNDTWPWPGKDHYDGADKFFTYQEANVERNGTPKPRDSQRSEGGAFEGKSFQEFKTLNR
jgi:hypothetical protein